ncbi:MAG: hypothetical protein ABEN55_20180 [Bradymonadaceae bacterium]
MYLFTFSVACGPPEGGPTPSDAGTDTGTAAADTAGAEVGDVGDTDGSVDADGEERRTTEDYPLAQCDALDPNRCSLPWPSNLYLAPDPDRTSGYQLRFGAESLPKASGGSHADPKPYRRRDGYGLGTPILAHFPNVDTSAMPDRYNVEASMADDAPVVLLEVQADGSVERVPYWVEMDAHASEMPRERLLIVRPAVILEENTRYIVAYRNLETTVGEAIEPSAAF